MKIWPIATATVSALVLAGEASAAAPAPVRMGVVLNAFDNPFFVAIYEGATAQAKQLGVTATVRSVTSRTSW